MMFGVLLGLATLSVGVALGVVLGAYLQWRFPEGGFGAPFGLDRRPRGSVLVPPGSFVVRSYDVDSWEGSR